MPDNGAKEQTYKDYSLESTVSTPLFEKDILIPSLEAMEAISQSYFPDKESLMVACQYIAWLELMGLEDEKKQALYVINGHRAIQSRSLRYAVQAHGGLYWPDEASKDDRKFLSKQFRTRDAREEETRDEEKR